MGKLKALLPEPLDPRIRAIPGASTVMHPGSNSTISPSRTECVENVVRSKGGRMSSEQQQALEFTAVTLLGKVYEFREKLSRYPRDDVPEQVILDIDRAFDMLMDIWKKK